MGETTLAAGNAAVAAGDAAAVAADGTAAVAAGDATGDTGRALGEPPHPTDGTSGGPAVTAGTDPGGPTDGADPTEHRRLLTEHQVHLLVQVGRFGLVLAAVLLALWITPLASTIDDEFGLAPTTEPEVTVPAAPTTTRAPRTTTTESPTTAPPETAPTTAPPTPETAPPPTPAPAAPTGATGGIPAPTPATPTGPTGGGAPASDGTTEAAAVAGMLAAGFGGPGATFTAAEQSCLAGALRGAYDPATLASMAAASAPAGLGDALLGLSPVLTTCFPLQTAILASLLEGATPPSVAACLAPEVARRVTWDPLLVVELRPADPTANDALAAAIAAATVCPLG